MSSWCWLHDVSCIGTNINKEYSSATAMHKCPLNAACSRILYVKNRRKSKSVQRLSKVDTSAVFQQLLPFLRGFVSDLWEAESSWALQLESLTSKKKTDQTWHGQQERYTSATINARPACQYVVCRCHRLEFHEPHPDLKSPLTPHHLSSPRQSSHYLRLKGA